MLKPYYRIRRCPLVSPRPLAIPVARARAHRRGQLAASCAPSPCGGPAVRLYVYMANVSVWHTLFTVMGFARTRPLRSVVVCGPGWRAPRGACRFARRRHAVWCRCRPVGCRPGSVSECVVCESLSASQTEGPEPVVHRKVTAAISRRCASCSERTRTRTRYELSALPLTRHDLHATELDRDSVLSHTVSLSLAGNNSCTQSLIVRGVVSFRAPGERA